jgi:DNA modification methylase
MSERCRILVGDCRATLPTLPEGSVHCAVSSPPYWGLRTYGNVAPLAWPEVAYAPMPGLAPVVVPAMTCALGLEPTPEAFVGHLVLIYREVRRVLRDDATCWINLGDTYVSAPGTARNPGGNWGKQAGVTGHVDGIPATGPNRLPQVLPGKNIAGIPWRVAFALQADGWWLRSDCVWSKPNPVPESIEDRPTKSHEYVFLLAKRAHYFYDLDAIREPHADERERRGNRNGNGKSAMRGQAELRPRGNLLSPERFRHPHGRNRRTVWSLATRPYHGAHFATFPEDLAEVPILAGSSARGCCPACGAPWRREVRIEGAATQDARATRGEADSARAFGAAPQGFAYRGAHTLPPRTRTTTGWRPGCACDAGAPVPCTVLDPFAGSGTTGAVALRHGRNAVLCELNPAYAPLIERRVAAASAQLGLFREVS